MDSLIDVGKIAQLGQLQEQRRRNDIYEENSLLQAEQNRIEQRKITENTDARKMKFFLDMANDPRVKANPGLANTALAQSWIVAQAPGYENPELVKQMLSKGSDSMRAMLNALSGGDAGKAAASMGELQVLMGAPYAEQLVQGQLNAGKLAEQAANIEAMRNVQRARFEKIHNAQSKINAGELIYSQGIRDFSTLLQGTDSKDYLKIAAAAAKIPPANGVHPRSIGAGLAKNQPDVARFGGPSYEQASATAAEQARKIADGVGQVEQTLQLVEMGEPLPPQTTKRDLIERIETGKTMIDAYTKMSSWADDPYNLKKLNDANAAQAVIIKKRAELENLKSSTSREAMAISQESLDFRKSEAGQKHTYDMSVGKAQAEALEQYGRTPTGGELALVSRKYGVKPEDVLPGLSDPAKKGKLEVGIRLGQEDVSRNLKMIESAQGVIDYTKDLRDLIHANPAIVGKGAQFGTALAGAGQQLRAIAKLDPLGARFLNTKTRDSAESLYEILVYLQARSMDPTGTLDVQVVKHARKTLGDLSALTTGPSQILNKLDVVTGDAERHVRRARRLLKGGAESALTDEPTSSKTVGEMTEEELLRRILQGAQP